MAFDIGHIGESIVNEGIGAGLGLLLGKENDRRQINQQQKLTDMQVQAQKNLTDYNRASQLQMWKDTNYGAQVQQMKQAGINPALLYGGGGGGGTTANVSTGSVSGASAPVGGHEAIDVAGMGIQYQLLEAQKANIEADTKLKEADAANKPIQGENIQASTKSLLAGVDNTEAETVLTLSPTVALLILLFSARFCTSSYALLAWYVMYACASSIVSPFIFSSICANLFCVLVNTNC